MCLGIPGEVIEFLPDQPDLARVDVSGVRRVINIGLLTDDPPKPGEWVLIHVGFALSKIDEDEAAAALAFLESIGQAYEDELAALQTCFYLLEGRFAYSEPLRLALQNLALGRAAGVLERAPTAIGSLSPRNTAPNQTLAESSRRTLPMTSAVSAMK